jgi:hypothetical protein
MRPCEYSSTEDNPKAKLLTLGAIRFYWNGTLLKNWSSECRRCQNNLPNPEKWNKDEPAIKRKTPKSHPPWCPGRIWALIVDHIWFNKGSTNDTPVNAIVINDEHHPIKTSTVSRRIRRAIIKLGEEPLSMNTEISTTSNKNWQTLNQTRIKNQTKRLAITKSKSIRNTFIHYHLHIMVLCLWP